MVVVASQKIRPVAAVRYHSPLLEELSLLFAIQEARCYGSADPNLGLYLHPTFFHSVLNSAAEFEECFGCERT